MQHANDQNSGWCRLGTQTHTGIERMLDFASANYTRQTEWFIKHCDRALLQLASVIAAEMAANQFVRERLAPPASAAIYILLAIMAGVVGFAGILNCRRAFRASLESVAMVNKAIWAMGFGGSIEVKASTGTQFSTIPFAQDSSFNAPRHTREAAKHTTTDALICSRLGEGWGCFRPRENTCCWSCISIACLACGGIGIGLMLAIRSF